MDLKELLGEDLYNQMMEKLGDKHKLAVVSDGTWIPKSKFDEVNNQKNTFKEQSDTLTKQLDDMKKAAAGNDELTKQIDALQGQLKDSQGKIKQISISSAIEKALIQASAKFPDLLSSKFDTTKIEIKEDGTVSGLEDQLKTLQETYKDLFGKTVISGGTPNPGGGNPTPNVDPNTLSDEEYFRQAMNKK